MRNSFSGPVRGIAWLGLVCGLATASRGQDASWLRVNHKQDPSRYEGLLDEPNALREYDVLAFLASAGTPVGKTFNGTPERLQIQFCQAPVAASRGETAFIEVRQLSGRNNYLMKTTVGAEKANDVTHIPTPESFSWPTKEVIHKNNIDPNKLGVVIHVGEDNEYGEDLAPAVFSASNEPAPATVDHYTLTLRIQQNNLDSLFYQIRPSAGSSIRCYYENDLHPCLSQKPENPTPIENGSLVRLRFDLSKVAAGPVSVHLEGKYHDQDGALTANFHFNHEPRCR